MGQNFLVDPSAPVRIVAAMGDLRDAITIEIGPGKGVITRLLAAESRALTAIEVDRELAASLQREFEYRRSVEILRQDILTADLTALAAKHGSRLRIAGNLPYYLTSDILLHLFRHAEAIECAVLMVQREVAERITAKPGVRNYGLLSVTAQLHASIEALFTLPPTAFSPPPQVDSTVLRFRMGPRFDELHVERKAFLAFLRRSFAMKRKTFANNLLVGGFLADAVADALRTYGLPPQIRTESIAIESLACLFRALDRRD